MWCEKSPKKSCGEMPWSPIDADFYWSSRQRTASRCTPDSLSAALGPAIGVECYPVGPEVRGLFRAAGHSLEIFSSNPRDPENWRLDLRAANRHQLLAAGLEEKRIHSVDRCTYSEENLHSFRRDGEKAGRLFNFIGLSCPED